MYSDVVISDSNDDNVEGYIESLTVLVGVADDDEVASMDVE